MTKYRAINEPVYELLTANDIIKLDLSATQTTSELSRPSLQKSAMILLTSFWLANALVVIVVVVVSIVVVDVIVLADGMKKVACASQISARANNRINSHCQASWALEFTRIIIIVDVKGTNPKISHFPGKSIINSLSPST